MPANTSTNRTRSTHWQTHSTSPAAVTRETPTPSAACSVHAPFAVHAQVRIRPIPIAPTSVADLALSITSQCSALIEAAREVETPIVHLKLHGALYHDANRSEPLARLCLDAALQALGRVVIVGPAQGTWRNEAKARALDYLVEGFADRGVRDDGTLIPRDQPGALITDAHACAARAQQLAQQGIGTICVHGDTENALAIARAVQGTLRALNGQR